MINIDIKKYLIILTLIPYIVCGASSEFPDDDNDQIASDYFLDTFIEAENDPIADELLEKIAEGSEYAQIKRYIESNNIDMNYRQPNAHPKDGTFLGAAIMQKHHGLVDLFLSYGAKLRDDELETIEQHVLSEAPMQADEFFHQRRQRVLNYVKSRLKEGLDEEKQKTEAAQQPPHTQWAQWASEYIMPDAVEHKAQEIQSEFELRKDAFYQAFPHSGLIDHSLSDSLRDGWGKINQLINYEKDLAKMMIKQERNPLYNIWYEQPTKFREYLGDNKTVIEAFENRARKAMNAIFDDVHAKMFSENESMRREEKDALDAIRRQQ